MAAVTLSTISAAGGPSWVTGTEKRSFVRFISSHGMYKTETLLFQCASDEDFTADDTFNSRLAHPLWVTVMNTSDIDDAEASIPSAEINSDESNSNFKQITLRDAEDVDGLGVMLTVYGF